MYSKKYFFFCSINVFCFYKILGMKYSEEQFLELLNSKQPKIFRILYQEYYNFMVSFSLNYVSRKEIAEDIVSDLFANIWTNNYQFQTFSNFKNFLYRSVRNASLDHLKHEKVKRRFLNIYVQEESEEESDFKIIEEEMYRLLFEIVDSLPKRCKEIFELHLDGKKNEEIASVIKHLYFNCQNPKSPCHAGFTLQNGQFISLGHGITRVLKSYPHKKNKNLVHLF